MQYGSSCTAVVLLNVSTNRNEYPNLVSLASNQNPPWCTHKYPEEKRDCFPDKLRYSVNCSVRRGVNSGWRYGVKYGVRRGVNSGLRYGVNYGVRRSVNSGLRCGVNCGVRRGVNSGLCFGVNCSVRRSVNSGLRCGIPAMGHLP